MAEFLNVYVFHWTPDRAMWLGGHTLWWDARCAGIYVGFGLGALFHWRAARSTGRLPAGRDFVIGACFAIPLFVDVLSVAWQLRRPSNDVRYFTGLLFGHTFATYLIAALVVLLESRHDRQEARSRWEYLAPLCTGLTGLALKASDSVIAYGLVQALAVFGAGTLLAILVIGIVKVSWNVVASGRVVETVREASRRTSVSERGSSDTHKRHR